MTKRIVFQIKGKITELFEKERDKWVIDEFGYLRKKMNQVFLEKLVQFWVDKHKK